MTKNLFLVLIIEIIFEVINLYLTKNNIVNYQFYRISALRHIVFLQTGIILFYYKEILLKNIYMIFPLAIVGAIYVYFVTYENFVLPPFYYWKSVSTPMVVYSLLVLLIIMKYSSCVKNFYLETILLTIGKASYHIFLFQMIYFRKIKSFVQQGIMIYIKDIIICLIGGIVFYFLETKYSKIILSKLKQIF